MRLAGHHRFEAPPEVVFEAICDPAVLLAVIPGAEAVERTGPDTWEGRIALRLPGAVGSYRTHVRLVDADPPARAGLDGRVEGTMGSVTGRADLELTGDPGSGTDLAWRGTARIDGPLARLDSRFAERLADSLISQGLRALDARLAMEGHE
jgi:carbon monoxide dehydrogenase subunit G